MQLSRTIITLFVAAGMLVAGPSVGATDQTLPGIQYIELPPPEPTERPPGRQWGGPTQMFPEMVVGEWSWTPEGRRVWRAGLRAPGARALRVHFEGFSTSGTVWLYAESRDEPAAGPYTGSGPHQDGGFWSGFVPGEAVMIVYLPADTVPPVDVLPFQLDGVSRITSPVFPVLTASGKVSGLRPRTLAGCHVDASCYPEVESSARAVALVAITEEEGTGYCTGFLVNLKHDDPDRFLMLTTGHCIETPEQARNAMFLWRYQTEKCYGDPDWENWEEPPVWTEGSELLAWRNDQDHDFALLRLDRDTVLSAAKVILLGWSTRMPRVGTEVYTVGHPDSDLKRISVGNIVSQRWSGINDNNYLTVDWRLGTIEDGSSGSPLLVIGDDYHYVVGMLTGGTRDEDLDEDSPWGLHCNSDVQTVFNRFDKIYDVIERYIENDPAAPAPATVTVTLGISGDRVTLRRDAEGVWWLGDSTANSGTTRVRASNGNSYVLTLETDGKGNTRWSATFVAPRVTVQLGTSAYRITLIQSEDGVWWQGTREATDGMTISTPTGKTYRLRFQDGEWTATEVSG